MSEAIPREITASSGQRAGTFALMACLRLASRLERKKIIANSLRDARRYERQAEQAPAESAAWASSLLSAGKARFNGRQPARALTHLETVLPFMENYKHSGTVQGFTQLAGVYQVIGAVYKELGNTQESANTHIKAVELADEMEGHFGLRTEFLPDGNQMVYSIRNADNRPLANKQVI